ncbi:MAG: hypothetical protein MZU95_08265 [Desulfomicrobium escambiense]|nr:hypothetical protein [Desulfomicrobium escambiense]
MLYGVEIARGDAIHIVDGKRIRRFPVFFSRSETRPFEAFGKRADLLREIGGPADQRGIDGRSAVRQSRVAVLDKPRSRGMGAHRLGIGRRGDGRSRAGVEAVVLLPDQIEDQRLQVDGDDADRAEHGSDRADAQEDQDFA